MIALVGLNCAQLRGAFTDATHFTIEPGTVQVVVTMQTQTSEDPLSAPFNLLAVACPRTLKGSSMAANMNRQESGDMHQRVFVSFHSNACGCGANPTARGGARSP